MKFQSISTPSIQHDEANILTELILLNRYHFLTEFCWRKGNPQHVEWTHLVGAVKNIIKRLKIHPDKLAWYVNKTKIQDINYDEFGLLHYKISKVFPSAPLVEIVDLYRKINEVKKQKYASSRPVNISQEYHMKEESNTVKSLTELLRELETNGK